MSSGRAREGTTGRRAAGWSVGVLVVAALVAGPASPAEATGTTRAVDLVLRAPAGVVAGVPFDVTVKAVGPRGGAASGYRGTVRFDTDDPLVRALPAAYRFTGADKGTHTFTGVTLVKPGARTLGVRDAGRPRLRDADRLRVVNARAAVEGQVLSGFDPVEGATVTVYDAVTGQPLASGPADIDGYYYRITGLPAGAVKLGAVVPGPYEPDFANDRDTLAAADVFVLRPGATLVQSWDADDFGPYLDVRRTE